MNKINPNDIKDFYENISTVWPQNDGWHQINQHEIKKYIENIDFSPNGTILNAGSGGNDYGLTYSMCHLDIVENKIKHLPNYVVGSVEAIPFSDETFDATICVGSVLNYCDAMLAIEEIARTLKTGGILVLEFETSYSFEYLGTETYEAEVAIANTMYFNRPHKLWVYSENYIAKLLNKFHFNIYNHYRFHIISGLIYKFTKNENIASKYAKLDVMFRHIPIIKKHSANMIVLCQKI